MYNEHMVKNRKTFFIGVFVSLIPFLGIPSLWKAILTVFFGIILIFSSLKFILPRRGGRSKIIRNKRERVTPVFVESAPVEPSSPKNITSENPPTFKEPIQIFNPVPEIETEIKTTTPAKKPKRKTRRSAPKINQHEETAPLE